MVICTLCDAPSKAAHEVYSVLIIIIITYYYFILITIVYNHLVSNDFQNSQDQEILHATSKLATFPQLSAFIITIRCNSHSNRNRK